MIRFKLDIYNHGIHVKVCFQQDREIMVKYNNTLRVFELRKIRGHRNLSRVLKCTFATYHPRDITYGLHKNLLPELLDHLKRERVSDKEIKAIIHKDHIVSPNTLELNESVKLRDHQVPIVSFLCKYIHTKVLPLNTGGGKTLSTLYSISKLKVCTAIIMGAMHIDTWCKEIKWMFKENPDNVMVIKGKKGMCKVIGLAKDNKLTASILIFSVNTIRDYLSEHIKESNSSYGCNPIDFYATLGVGLRVIDEAHENLHFQFRHDISTNVKSVIYLSATIDSNNAFTNKMYGVIFPHIYRYNIEKWEKYITCTALGYGLEFPNEVRCLGPTKQYNHTVYESWILYNYTRLKRYLKLITEIVDKTFHKRYVKGGKMLIFMASVEMCRKTADHLKVKFPQYSCNPYTAEHDVEVLHSNDIVITTPLSCGTGKDIKKVMTILLTVSIASKEKSSQIIGRLRSLKDQLPGVSEEFYYLICRDIENHINGHRLKLKLYPKLTKKMLIKNLNHII